MLPRGLFVQTIARPKAVPIRAVPSKTGSGVSTGGIGSSTTISLSPIDDGSVLGNISGSSESPDGVTTTELLDYLVGTPATNELLIRGVSNWGGLVSPSDATKYLDGTGNYSVPAGTGPSGGSMLPLVTGDLPGPVLIADGFGQCIGVPL